MPKNTNKTGGSETPAPARRRPSRRPESERAAKRKNRTSKRSPRSAKALRANPFLALLGEVKTDIDARLGEFFDAKVDAARPLGADVGVMISATRDLCLRGGKRLRPALAVAGYRAVERTMDWEHALKAGVALELLQAFFLIHDDWMDQDSTRRGGPSVHTHLGRRFRSQRLGDCSAILAGDYAAAMAAEAMARIDLPGKRMQALFTRFAEMQAAAITGQQLDLLGRTDDPELTYRLKTASYTVSGPLALGAIIAGGSVSQRRALERYALPVGVAFQLRDDMLSLFGDPAETGKPFGNDLRSGKRTPLVLAALARSKPRERDALVRVLGNPRATKRQLERAIAIISTCGALDVIEARIGELVASGLAALEKTTLTDVGSSLLVGAASALTRRDS